jgi:RimJ/RimL family protein N-acetyltransferase
MAGPLWRHGRSVTIVRLTPDDAGALQDLRREALQLHPTAFSADPDIEAKLTLDDWRERIRNRIWFGSKVDQVLCGMAAFSTEGSKKTRHTGHLGSMYVRREFRGTGMADDLIKAFLEHAFLHVEQVMLTVEASNLRAIKLYERHGFRPIGRMPRSLLIDGQYFDELQMFRTVSASD